MSGGAAAGEVPTDAVRRPSGAAGVPQGGQLVLVPLIAGLVVLAFASFPLDRALVAACLAAVLVVLAATDIRRGIIPNRIVVPASGLILLAQVALFPDRAQEWILAGLVAAVALAIPPLLGRAWMGMGDAKLALLLGVGL